MTIFGVTFGLSILYLWYSPRHLFHCFRAWETFQKYTGPDCVYRLHLNVRNESWNVHYTVLCGGSQAIDSDNHSQCPAVCVIMEMLSANKQQCCSRTPYITRLNRRSCDPQTSPETVLTSRLRGVYRRRGFVTSSMLPLDIRNLLCILNSPRQKSVIYSLTLLDRNSLKFYVDIYIYIYIHIQIQIHTYI